MFESTYESSVPSGDGAPGPANSESPEICRMHAESLAVSDAHDLANSLTHGAGIVTPAFTIPPIAAVPASVSFDVEWSGEISRETVVNEMQQFRGDFIKTGSTIKWSSIQNGFSYESEDPNPARNVGATMGRERNGVFFDDPNP